MLFYSPIGSSYQQSTTATTMAKLDLRNVTVSSIPEKQLQEKLKNTMPLPDQEGEVRELTEEEFARARPINDFPELQGELKPGQTAPMWTVAVKVDEMSLQAMACELVSL